MRILLHNLWGHILQKNIPILFRLRLHSLCRCKSVLYCICQKHAAVQHTAHTNSSDAEIICSRSSEYRRTRNTYVTVSYSTFKCHLAHLCHIYVFIYYILKWNFFVFVIIFTGKILISVWFMGPLNRHKFSSTRTWMNFYHFLYISLTESFLVLMTSL